MQITLTLGIIRSDCFVQLIFGNLVMMLKLELCGRNQMTRKSLDNGLPSREAS